MKRLIVTLVTALGMCLFLVLSPVAKGAEKSKTKTMGETPTADKALVYFIRMKRTFGAGRTARGALVVAQHQESQRDCQLGTW